MKSRQTLLLECSYLGRYFYGVQCQRGMRTVAGELGDQLRQALNTETRGLTFAARTDAGVSAHQNYATCWYRGEPLTQDQLARLTQPRISALQINRAQLVPRAVNARSSSCGKHYQYRVKTGVPAALVAQQADDGVWSITPRLCLDAMRSAARPLVGTHDFSAFRAVNCDAKSPIKTVLSVSVRTRDDMVIIDVEGSAFLRKMVRILVGTLVEVGAGIRRAEDTAALIQSRERKNAGLTAPARGLWLMSVSLLWPQMRHPGMPLMRT